jgi:hypothetical protein
VSGEDYIMRNLMTCTHHQIFSGNQIEKNERGRTCSTYGGKERCIQDFGREGDHLGDPGADGRIILKWIFKQWDGGMDWIELAQDRDRWRALVNAVLNLLVPLNSGNFLTS